MKTFADIRNKPGYMVALPGSFDLYADHADPQIYDSAIYYHSGKRLSKGVYRWMVDHDATGTATAGTGDTVVFEV